MSVERLEHAAQRVHKDVNVLFFDDQGRRQRDDIARRANKKPLVESIKKSRERPPRGLSGNRLEFDCTNQADISNIDDMAREVGGKGIRVNSIAPGWILTERQVSRARAIYQGKFDDYLDRQCLKEFLLPPDVARMALFLCADDSRMITGQTFIVDGGVV